MSVQTVWPRCPEAANFLQQTLAEFAAANPMIGFMADRLLTVAGVSLIHLIDHWVLPDAAETRNGLVDCGFEETQTPDGDPVLSRPGARLAFIRLTNDIAHPRMALAVENIFDFAEAWGLPDVGKRGDTGSGYEEARYPLPCGELAVIVRLGYSGFRPGELGASSLRSIRRVRERIRGRERPADVDAAIEQARALLIAGIEEIGPDRATDEFFAAEREFYMTRNAAARRQFRVQQQFGIGWANQDHHTYRSSRRGFRALVELWSRLGFECRERFYAGAEAGWGAQIMEHPVSRVVLFCDVDIAPHELDIDFSQADLPPTQTLGTIGLWCGLHGDSISEAGMHHLECEYDFENAVRSLRDAGFGVMAPFTDLPMLKQAFTVAENWPVSAERAADLCRDGYITFEQASRFIEHGAAGSHLEILQRWEGFKGFNKTGVSSIILATDARNTGNRQ